MISGLRDVYNQFKISFLLPFLPVNGMIAAPILKLKQALQKMESEILTMNVQISVIEQSLLQSQLKNRAAYNDYFQNLHISL